MLLQVTWKYVAQLQSIYDRDALRYDNDNDYKGYLSFVNGHKTKLFTSQTRNVLICFQVSRNLKDIISLLEGNNFFNTNILQLSS